jgi:hypothetical protein
MLFCLRTMRHAEWNVLTGWDGYKHVKDELGWADFQVRSDIAIRRHQALVNCAFSFCWAAWFADHPAQPGAAAPRPGPAAERGEPLAAAPPSWPRALRAVRARLSPGSRCSAGGTHGPRRPRPRRCKP